MGTDFKSAIGIDCKSVLMAAVPIADHYNHALERCEWMNRFPKKTLMGCCLEAEAESGANSRQL